MLPAQHTAVGFVMSRILTAYSSNNGFHPFLETALHTAEEHNGANLKLSATPIVMAFLVTRVRIVRHDQSFDVMDTGRSTTYVKFTLVVRYPLYNKHL
jgi:uncharacterized membrane protein (DUF485 family)